MRVTFPRSENRTTLSDPIRFTAVEGKRRIVCKVAQATLLAADRNATGRETIHELWNRYIDFVEDVAARIIELGYFEPDGSVVVRDKDLERARRAAQG
jgi:hypothetical protein